VEHAKAMLHIRDAVLLDKHTNHMDIKSIKWLEAFLINYTGAVVLVWNDREFSDDRTKMKKKFLFRIMYFNQTDSKVIRNITLK